MVTLSDTAKTQLDEYFAKNDKAPIRIFLSNSCAGARLALALDEPGDTDESFDVSGYTFVVDKELGVKAAPLGVDFDCGGFVISSSLELGGGGCGSCSCGGSCS